MSNYQMLTAEDRRARDWAFTHCHVAGHSWETATPQRVPQFGAIMMWQCIHCGSFREDLVSRDTGERLARPRYIHADGYKLHGTGEAKQSKNEWRFTFLKMTNNNSKPSKRVSKNRKKATT